MISQSAIVKVSSGICLIARSLDDIQLIKSVESILNPTATGATSLDFTSDVNLFYQNRIENSIGFCFNKWSIVLKVC